MAQCKGAPLLDGKTFFCLHVCIWKEDLAKISKVPGAPRNVNSARAITCLVSVIIYCTIFQKRFSSTSPVFRLRDNMLLEKKLARENTQ